MVLDIALSHDFGRFTIDAAFTAPVGITALVGPSGSGKSSVINAVSGQFRPRHSKIAIGGRTLADSVLGIYVPPHRRKVAQVFQDSRLFPHLSVAGNLLYGWRRTGQAASETAIAALVERLGIGHLLQARPSTLSGGEGQRVALGRALLSNPQALLLDEPLAALDEARKQEIFPYLENLRDAASIPIVYVTHSVAEVARLANFAVLMSHGRIAAQGTAFDVLPQLSLAGAGHDLQAASVLTGIITGHDHQNKLTRFNLGQCEVIAPLTQGEPGESVRLRIGIDDVLVGLEAPDNISAHNILPATVTAVSTASSGYTDVKLTVDGQVITARLLDYAVRRLGLSQGQQAYAIIKAVNVLR
jgi:molybdate transport system ATP-binding protein